MKYQISVKEIIQRLKTSLNINSDDKLAELIGVSRPTVTNWKARNSIDYTLIFELFPELDLNWIIYGVSKQNAPMFRNENHANNSNGFKVGDIEVALLKKEIQILKEQLRDQRQDYINEIERLLSGRQNSELEANIVKAG